MERLDRLRESVTIGRPFEGQSKTRVCSSVCERSGYLCQCHIVAIGGKLDAGCCALVAQDFRHATQGPQNTVHDYILRLERIFQRAYGRNHMTEETRKILLHGQL